MGKTYRRGGSERGYYSPGKSIRDKRQKVEQIVLHGKTIMKNQTLKVNPKDESSTPNLMMMLDGTDTEKESEELEFDDLSEVDYDLDYTVQY